MTEMKEIRNLSSDARGNKQVNPFVINNLIVDVEKFHSFREVHTPDWHRRRHQVAQSFLDQFMRKNTADIDEIPWTEHKVSVVLPAAERAIYLELKHHLDALDMVLKKG